jgi:prolyl oligopeptidase
MRGLTAIFCCMLLAAASPDPFLWLEQRHGARALAWVKEQDAKTLAVLQADPHYQTFFREAVTIDESKSRIPFPALHGGDIYNFWQGAGHVRGFWRRTSISDYVSRSPHWTTVLDLDAVAKREHANWVWEGANCAEPMERKCIVALSDGGEDAQTLREFDVRKGAFVKNGFSFPRGKQTAAWLDADSLLVARQWRPGEITTSGYPYIVKRVRRGEPLSRAALIFRGSSADVGSQPEVLHDGAGGRVALIERDVSFFKSEYHLMTTRGLQRWNLPPKTELMGMVAARILIKLNQDWRVGAQRFAQGSVVWVDAEQSLAAPATPRPRLLYAPGPRETLDSLAVTKDAVLLVAYHDVRARAHVYTIAGGGWNHRLLRLPDNASIGIATASIHSDDYYLYVVSFLRPTTLYAGNALSGHLAPIKRLPPQFDASRDAVEQHQALSKDGTRVPYFIVHPAHMQPNAKNPAVIDAYGGFDISMTPYYSGVLGKLWLERGGVYVLANIRGGGEFGPAWHDAALKTHRQRAYDDFYAVAKDLVARKITTPRYLGIMGGSNGGLLMGVEFTQHPEMWHAVDIQVPLLDMLRYEKIEAGASWVSEYGSVKIPAERAFLEKISPYQNLHRGVAYPQALIWTTTKDDRVGPQHARKFAAKLASLGAPYFFYEVTEGGHGSGANLHERAETNALEWTYFTMKLMEHGTPK